MNKFKEKLLAFYRSIYGVDQLNLFILIVAIVVSLIGRLLDIPFTSLLYLALVVLWLFRFFSKNFVLRSNENRKYLEIISAFKKRVDFEKRRYADRKTHVYRKCKHCKANVRLPRKKGLHTVKCPKCSERFEVKIHF